MLLLVGTADEYLVNIANTYSTDAVLITESNWNELAHNLPTVGYTGSEEFIDKIILLNVLLSATKILYHPKPISTDFDIWFPTHSTRGLLERQLILVNQTIPVINLELHLLGKQTVNKHLTEFLKLTDIRKTNTNKKQLWVAGGSDAHGMGVEKTDRFMNLISDKFNLPLNDLSIPGGAISRLADQILRSNIQKDDIVILSLTPKERKEWWFEDNIHNITIESYSRYSWLKKVIPERALVDVENSHYQSLTHIHQVINFCQKVKAKLLIFGITGDPADVLYLRTLPNFYQYYSSVTQNERFVDYAVDDAHPGPQQHRLYADTIIEQLQKRNWI
jgi:hypothetical protein